MAVGSLPWTAQFEARAVKTHSPRRAKWGGTPEVYFTKQIDNSRLVKVSDTKRTREMAVFSCTMFMLIALCILYACQHFSSIEYGYAIEAQKLERERLVELNRALKLEEASLRNPERIHVLAKQMGLQSPQAGQVLRLENNEMPSMPVMARANNIAVIASVQ